MSIVFFEQGILPHIPVDSFIPYTFLSVFIIIFPLYFFHDLER